MKLWQQWQQLLAADRLHHAILLSAPNGSGRLALAGMLAKTLLCQKGQLSPCSQCHSCQLFDADTHPDFHILKPEKQGKLIGVDAVRQSNHWALETSQLGGQRVILIQHAESLGEAAANAILKTLEEPPASCHFILLTDSIDSLLPTITSRCNKWKAPLPDENVVKRWVEDELYQSIPLQVVRLHRGAPLAAKAFIEEGNIKIHHQVVTQFCEYLQSKSGLFSAVDLLVKHYPSSLDWISYLLLDLVKVKSGIEEDIVHCNLMETLSVVAAMTSTSQLHSQLRTLNRLQRKLTQHTGLNTELLVSQWLLEFGE